MGSSDTFPTLESLHFPEQLSISQTLSSLRRSALSVANRLQSIETDATFAQEVADHYGLPLVANERCGSWYIPPTAKAGSAYFKSTDGHTGQWDFSFRRLNLQLLPLAKDHGGLVSHFHCPFACGFTSVLECLWFSFIKPRSINNGQLHHCMIIPRAHKRTQKS
jgi:hypothetical protein